MYDFKSMLNKLVSAHQVVWPATGPSAAILLTAGAAPFAIKMARREHNIITFKNVCLNFIRKIK